MDGDCTRDPLIDRLRVRLWDGERGLVCVTVGDRSCVALGVRSRVAERERLTVGVMAERERDGDRGAVGVGLGVLDSVYEYDGVGARVCEPLLDALSRVRLLDVVDVRS